MRKVTIFEMPSTYRTPFSIAGFTFGEGKKSAAFVGGVRGNEIQQVYVCSQLVKQLKKIEAAGGINPDHMIEVIPCLNPYSINIIKRFWAMDGTDINRMFPGYDKGETTQRIAAGIFKHLQGFQWGVHFASFYLRGDFLTHVRMLKTDFTDEKSAEDFGLPFTLLREPLPIDTTTLNYNWQIWNTMAYTILTARTASIDPVSARLAINAVLRFLKKKDIIDYPIDGGRVSQNLREEQLEQVHALSAGIWNPLIRPGTLVEKDQIIGEILDPLTGEVLNNVTAPASGTIFFVCHDSLIVQHQILFLIARNIFCDFAAS